MAHHSLKDLYIDELRDLYDAERQISKALPQMMKASSSPDLRQAFQKHQEETNFQMERLDLIFKKLGNQPQGKHCRGIEGIIAEGMEHIREGGAPPDVSDAAIIASAQRIEHYEIAAYGTARTFAERLEDDYSADLLQRTLDEEGAADKLLTSLAEGGINQGAGAGRTLRGSGLTFVRTADLPAAETGSYGFSDVRIVGTANDDLGQIDGFVIDRRSGRPYYVVVDSGGWFTGNRYLLPINSVNFDRNSRQMRTTLDKDTIKKYPEFDRSAFETGGERSTEYESRLMQAYGREPVRAQEGWWDYDRMEEFRKPDWWNYDRWTPSEMPPERDRVGGSSGSLTGRGERDIAPGGYEPGSEGRSRIDDPRLNDPDKPTRGRSGRR